MFVSMDQLSSSCVNLTTLLTFAVYIIVLLIFTPLIIPLIVVITAAQANYAPKVVHLRDKTFEETSPGSFRGVLFNKDTSVTSGTTETSTISILGRIKRLEGWRGLYRSTILQALNLGVLSLVALIHMIVLMIISKDIVLFAYLSNISGILMTLFAFPCTVLVSRAIVHPVKLNWLDFRASLQKIMSEAEYLQPWRLFTIPGAFLAVFLRWLLLGPATTLIKSYVGSSRSLPVLLIDNEGIHIDPDATFSTNSLLKFILYCGWSLTVVNIMVPLNCIIVRLMTQRSEKSYWEKTTPVQADDIEQMREKGPIVSLRPCFGEEHPGWNYFGIPHVEPYKGILDCGKKMRSEEGWNSLRHVALLSILECLASLL
ncbi:hypothetical protein MNAN1_001340b, partial [Malassezia nana]